jgi:hypothetical protein
MRKLLLLLIAIALAYTAWPIWAAWQLRAAVKARDLAGIESRVDWPTLRANLKQTVGAQLKSNGNSDAGKIKALRDSVGGFLAERVIDAAVTPQTLVHVLTGRVLLKEIGRGTSAQRPAPPKDGASPGPSDPLAPRRLRWAFFETPTRFRIEMADTKEPQRRVVSVLELQGSGWKLVDVYYKTLS